MAAYWGLVSSCIFSFSRLRSEQCKKKPGEPKKELSLEKSPVSKSWENWCWTAGDALKESCQNGKCAEMYEPGVLGRRAWPCSVPNSISFIAIAIRQICQLARMRKRKISVLKNQSRNLSKKSKIIEFVIKVFRNLLLLWRHRLPPDLASVCRGRSSYDLSRWLLPLVPLARAQLHKHWQLH